MFRGSVLVLCFVALFVFLGSVKAISSEDKEKLREAMKPFIMQCIEEFGVSEETIAEVEKKKNANDVDPCFIGCIFKKSGIIDDKGKYDVQTSVEIAKPFISNNLDIAVLEKVSKDCGKVNDENVSDGEKGCDRSKLLFACFVDHKDEIDF